jgi:hypothetical protein
MSNLTFTEKHKFEQLLGMEAIPGAGVAFRFIFGLANACRSPSPKWWCG